MAVNLGIQSDSSTKRRVKLPERNLAPLNAITYIDPTGLATLSPEQISPDQAGWKAYGLSSVPSEWVPKFLVISADCFGRSDAEEGLQAVLKQGMSRAGIGGSVVMLRSSGTAETIQYRGRLFSKECAPEEIVATA